MSMTRETRIAFDALAEKYRDCGRGGMNEFEYITLRELQEEIETMACGVIDSTTAFGAASPGLSPGRPATSLSTIG